MTVLTNSLPTILAAGLLAPAFLAAGLALAVIPVVIHILNRRRYKTVQWAAMDFLLRAMKKNRRRLKFESWLLLAMRCCVLGLLGLALARPSGCDAPAVSAIAGQRSGLHVIVVDNSLSMSYAHAHAGGAGDHLARAKDLAKESIDRMSGGGEAVVLITAARPAVAVLPRATYDLDAANAAVARIEPTYAGTDLAGAFRLALDAARNETRFLDKQLVIYSDATRSAWEGKGGADAIEQLVPDVTNTFRIAHFGLGAADQSNAAVAELRPSARLVTTTFGTDFLAAVARYGPPVEATTTWRVDDAGVPGGAAVRLDRTDAAATLANAPLPGGGPHVVSLSVNANDRLRPDDARWRAVNVVSELKVLIVEGERSPQPMRSSGAFLQVALSPGTAGNEGPPASAGGYVAAETISDLELAGRLLDDYAAVVLAGVPQVQPQVADNLARFVNNGGALLLFMGEAVNADNYNAVLGPRRLLPGPLTQRLTTPTGGKPFSFAFDNENPGPLLDVFKGQRDAGLDRVSIDTYWQTAPEPGVERVLNYVPAGDAPPDPAITTHAVGGGRVVFVSTSANADWTTLPLRTAYVPLVNELLANSVTSGDRWMNLTTGDAFRLPSTLKLTAAPVLTDPANRPVDWRTIEENGATITLTPPLARPGVYTLNTGSRSYPIVVNVPDDEADVRTLDSAALRAAFGGADSVQLLGADLPPTAADADGGWDYAWPLMLAVLLFVAAESFVAMRFGHNRGRVPTGAR
ncbi:MAG TPA: BatA domain-containing protein [Tepidisphaeraceae bacterium]|nr:BatA domain-containing protein [Tepidisphaeraceae bacterium]